MKTLINRTDASDTTTSSTLTETLFSNGTEYFDALLNDIQTATKTILLETYIFNLDLLGQKIMTALIQAQHRGVKVKVMVDGVGSTSFIAKASEFEKLGIKTKIYHPFPWHIWSWSRSAVTLPSLLKGIYLLLNIPRRNHRKVCLIDDSIAYVGSINIAKSHLTTNEGGQNWRDTGIRLSGRPFTELIDSFERAWHHRSIKEVLKEAFHKVGRNPVIRLNNSRHRRRILYKQLLRRVHKAQHRVWVTNSYFIPDTHLLKKLKEAASHGCDVRLLVPHKGDTWLPMPWASACFYQSLLKAGVRIFEFLPSILHAKSFIIDDWVIVGSSNLDYLSLLHNLEVDVRLSNKDTIEQAKSLFLQDLNHAKEISIKTLDQHRPLYQRILGRLMLILRYWI